MRYVTRAEWGARRPTQPLVGVAPSRRTMLLLHYTTGQELGRADTAEWVRQLQAFHQGPRRRWADIGYHFLVAADGTVYEGRGKLWPGAHCPGHNVDAYGVAFLGNDDPDDTDATPQARAAITELWADLSTAAGRGLTRAGHRQYRATACPGDELQRWWVDEQGRMAGPTAGRSAPKFPLPEGAYFGPHGGPAASRSGYARKSDRDALARWQRQVLAIGADLGPAGADGYYGPRGQTRWDDSYTGRAAAAVQDRYGLTRDGLIGPRTWAAPWAG